MKTNSWLLNDVSRCSNDDCSLRLTCQRWLDDLPFEGNRYPVSKFEPDASGECGSYISVNLATGAAEKESRRTSNSNAKQEITALGEGSVGKENKTS